MAVIDLGERWSARDIDTTLQEPQWTSTVQYIATSDIDNENHWDVYNYANLNGPAADGPLIRTGLSVDQITARRFLCVYDFSHPDSEATDPTPQPADPSVFSFNTVGGSLQVTSSLQTVFAFGDGFPIGPGNREDLDFKQALNVDPETKKPSPVSIVNGQLGYVEQKSFDPASIDCAYLELLRDATATTNIADWKCFKAGEALFTGVTGQQQGTGLWALTFNFQIRKNLVDETYPDPIPSAPNQVITYSKKGHEYFWVYLYDWTDPQALPGAKTTIKRPAVYVEEMYNASDFSLLGIGV